ncbi:MAG: ABC transporter permease [Pseudorhodobacter sp.]|nr:ABC transporter permease [Frankiaceae bacterium]
MMRYILRRLIGVVLLLLLISFITFAVFFTVPADPALSACGKGCNPVRLAEIHAKLGLDKPVFPAADSQYSSFLLGLVRGKDFVGGGSSVHCDVPCFGYSFKTDAPVWPLLLDRLPVTLSIAVGAAFLWLVMGLTTGILSALKRGSAFDRGAMGLALAGVSLPVYFTALVMLYLLCSEGVHLGGLVIHPFGYPEYKSFLGDPVGWFKNLLLPWFTLAFLYAALYARLTRANMLETMGEDYIRTARAKGLSESRVIGKHGLRAALTPIVTIFGLDLGALLGGAIITESVYNFAGLGQFALLAINNIDLPEILGVTLFAAFFIVLANLVVDVLYAFVDPKVTYS